MSEQHFRSGEVSITEGSASTRVHAPYVVGDLVRALPGTQRPEKLARDINTTFLGTLSPPALLDPRRGQLLAYSSFSGGAPALRLRDLATDKESILDDGAYSLAWRRDGALAYFKALEPRVSDIRQYVGHVVARTSLRAGSTRWTRKAGRYVVAAWAGSRLLAYAIPGRTFPDILVFDGPGRVRTLARKSALVAVSPDADYVFVARYAALPPVVRVLAVVDGREVARLALGEEAGEIAFVAESGSWVGDSVFAAVTHGIAAFRVRPPEIALEQVLSFAAEVFPIGPLEPRAHEDGRRILVWAELQARPREAIPPAAVLACDRIELRCTRAASGPSLPGVRIVYNPSRP